MSNVIITLDKAHVKLDHPQKDQPKDVCTRVIWVKIVIRTTTRI